ncbi:MAG: LamG domain-containing protein [Euzebyaceae bacterium]|nr:LamG domain-containing protein [Euzebyaceae bacterium]
MASAVVNGESGPAASGAGAGPRPLVHKDLPLVGYADPWSVAPGERVRFMVSCEHPTYRAQIVRLLHGDDRPGAPGLKEETVDTPIDGEYTGHPPSYPTGSSVVVPDDPALRLDDSFTLAAWIFPTMPDKGAQGLLTKWSGSGDLGYALVIDERGELALWLGARGREAQRVSSGAALRAGQWYFVAAAYDATRGSVLLIQRPFPSWPLDATAVAAERAVETPAVDDDGAPFVMAAWSSGPEAQRPAGRGHYNGKIEAPVVYGAALGPGALEAVERGAAVADAGPVRAAWDFALDTPTDRIRDVSGNGLDGRTVNLPARAMSGHAFGGGERAWTSAPETHGALHFHDDDLDDCGWDVAFELTVPDSLRSGVYAAKLSAGDSEYHVPFFVRPAGRRATAPILFLVPTNSYLAYANFREAFAQENGVLGLYHFHGDGSAVLYSSARRPIVNLRPRANFDILDDAGAPHQFNADLYLVDWLTVKGFEFDVATDEDLDREGAALLDQYRVVLTGSHPEYWSGAMLDGLEAYLGHGGRLLYLGGNGLIWATTFDQERRNVVEVRRGGGGMRDATPGERYHSTTGEFGGPWRERGRPPNRLAGVGSIAQGFDRSSPYQRQPDSFDPRAAWIFDGVGDDEPIGDFGLTMGGAAGFEVDCADASLGTPPHTLVLASATEFSPTYEHQHPVHVAGTDVDLHDPMRCDMVFFETPDGGAVFSVGSIAYCGALSHNGYDNNVSRITENVLRRFSAARQ